MEYKSTILIVDDNLAGRETLKGLLFGRGYNLLFASNGLEAIKKVDQHMPDLVLLDVMMPGMDGFEVCRRIRANPKVAEIPVIMVTALDDRDSRLRGIEAGADDFVSKPFDHTELRTRVQTIVRLNRYRRLLLERTKFEWVVEQADDGYLIIDNHDRILYANPQAQVYLNAASSHPNNSGKFLDLARQEYNCEPFSAWSVWPKPSRAALPRYLVRPASPDSNPFWLKVDLVDMNLGDGEEYLIRLRDVSPAVAENRSMWTFHGQVSHKLRTPLNHLFASLDLIQDEDLANLDPDIKAVFNIAKQGAIQLKDEIQGIFQFMDTPSITQSGHNSCNLAQIESILLKANVYVNIETLKLDFNGIKKPADYNLMLSQQGMELILLELLENAKKFHPEKTPQLQVMVDLNDKLQAVIRVQDDGRSLSPEQLEKMWVPYYQAEKYFTGQIHGTGLGLSMVTSLVWDVGGICRAYNRPNAPGVVIELVIPLHPTSAALQ